MNHISIDKLNEHLFETIEMLKNNKDPRADEHEKIDIETARAIADLGKVAVEGYKVKVQALNALSKADNYRVTEVVMRDSGIISEKDGRALLIGNK